MATMKVQPAILRKLNESRVLNALRVNRIMSRADLQRELDTTMPTISRVVDTLIEQGWVLETGFGDTTMGRPPVMLEINPSSPVAIGVEVGRDVVRMVVVNLHANILHQVELKVEVVGSAQGLVNSVKQLIQDCGIPITAILGVGIAAPGAQDPHPDLPKRLMEEETHHHWQRDKIEELIVEQIGLPAWIENDANAAVLGELWFGKESCFRHLLFVYADEGVGAGIALNGALYRGENNSAGEFAHTIVDMNSDHICECGRRGCMGVVSHAMAIRDAVRKAHNGEVVSLKESIERAKNGIEPEAKIIAKILDYLSVGIINLVQVLDPSVVILGGSTFLTDDFMVMETTRRLQSLMHPRAVKIVRSSFGYHAVAIGASALVLQSVFDHTQVMEAQ